MSLVVMGMSEDNLERASVADIAAALLAKDEPAFRAALATVDRQQLEEQTARFAALMGYRPPAMIAEWRAVEAALPTHDVDACWTGAFLSIELDLPTELLPKEDRGEFLAGYAEGLFAGLFQLSEEESDRGLVCLLPSPGEPPVLVRSHEGGLVAECRTLKSFLVSVALRSWDRDAGDPPGAVGMTEYVRLHNLLSAHEARSSSMIGRTTDLLARCEWLMAPLWNEASVEVEALARAPTIDDWDRERAGELEPVLLNYWTVAHLLLGNLADAADAARRARQGGGEATRWLGQLTERVLAGDPSANVGRLGPRELQAVREQLRRKAPPGLLRH